LVLFVVFKSVYYEDLTYLCYNFSSSSNLLFAESCSEDSDYSDIGYFVTFFILYNNFIPISLYVTVEVCNYFQAFFIDNDVQMYDSVSNTPALARTSNMNSDLGMVEYIFSDKTGEIGRLVVVRFVLFLFACTTGTLTDNIMRFRRCSIAGVVYGDAPSDEQAPAVDKSGVSSEKQDHEAPMHHNSKFIAGQPLADLLNLVVENDPPAQVPTNSSSSSSSSSASGVALDAEARQRQKAVISDFVLCLALCHTVVLDAETGSYQSESPVSDGF
jgi:magnesium-transporting ATPase (P-type)